MAQQKGKPPATLHDCSRQPPLEQFLFLVPGAPMFDVLGEIHKKPAKWGTIHTVSQCFFVKQQDSFPFIRRIVQEGNQYSTALMSFPSACEARRRAWWRGRAGQRTI